MSGVLGWIVNLSNKSVTSNVFSLFHSTVSNFSRIKMFPIFFERFMSVLHTRYKNRKSSIL